MIISIDAEESEELFDADEFLMICWFDVVLKGVSTD
jgi:hypothetical protein